MADEVPINAFVMEITVGDDDIDIISSANYANTIVWFENDGHENFLEHEITSNFTSAWNLEVLDIDHDGDLDVWVEGVDYNLSGPITAWFENDGNQNFIKHNSAEMFGIALTLWYVKKFFCFSNFLR